MTCSGTSEDPSSFPSSQHDEQCSKDPSMGKADADLRVLGAAWPGLPEAIRAGIMAMVEATLRKESHRVAGGE